MASSGKAQKHQTRSVGTAPAPSDAVVVTDGVGLILAANAAACEWIDLGPRFLKGKTLAAFVDRADLLRFRNLVAHAHEKPVHTFELRLRKRTGMVATVRGKMLASADREKLFFRFRIPPSQSGVFPTTS